MCGNRKVGIQGSGPFDGHVLGSLDAELVEGKRVFLVGSDR
jgi:hypothetical protein